MNLLQAFPPYNPRSSYLVCGKAEGMYRRMQNIKRVHRCYRLVLARIVAACAFMSYHKPLQGRAHASKFIHIYTHFRYAGVTTVKSRRDLTEELITPKRYTTA